MLGLRFCSRASSSCGKWGPLFIHRGARASHYRGLSCCGAQAPDAQAQQLWLTGLVAPRHVGSSQTRARTCVPCISRQILNHCATREAQNWNLYSSLQSLLLPKSLPSHQMASPPVYSAAQVKILAVILDTFNLLFSTFNRPKICQCHCQNMS